MSQMNPVPEAMPAAAREPRGREHPILFSAPMVRAILEGRKTQTRRVMKPQPSGWDLDNVDEQTVRDFGSGRDIRCPYGTRGDRLWVRETWGWDQDGPHAGPIQYRADADDSIRWRPSIHMPRAYSRILLEVTDVRVELLQDISEEDARAEGTIPFTSVGPDQTIAGDGARRTQLTHPHTVAFASLWDGINFDRGFGWIENPWVWVVEFRRIRP